MEILTTDSGISFRIPSKKNRIRKFVALFLSIVSVAFGIYAGMFVILESHLIQGLVGIGIFLWIGAGYLDAFFWHIKGEEIFIIELDQGFYQKRSLFKGFTVKFKLNKDFSIELFDPKLHLNEASREPRAGDGMSWTYGGKVWVWLGKKSFRFGPQLSKDEAKAIVQEVATYARKWI